MALNPFGVAAIPGGIGGTTLGLGIVMSLHDQFSKQSTRVERRMLMLDRTTSAVAGRMSRNMGVLNAAIGGLAVAAVGLATLSFPVRSALKFEDTLTKLSVVVSDTVSKGQLQKYALDLASIFPQDPTEMAEALGTVVKAGIDNIDKAVEITRVSNQLAIATGGNLGSVVEGMTSIINAYQIGIDDTIYSTEDAAKRFERVASTMFEAMKVGKFSDVMSVEDVEAMTKQFGQIAPTMAAMNIPINEFFAIWATSTLGGQNARRSATGIRQSMMDIQNRTRTPSSMPEFTQWAKDEDKDPLLQAGDLTRFVQQNGYYALLGAVRDYATIGDTSRLEELISSENFQDRMDEVMSGIPEDMSYEDALASDPALAQLVKNVKDIGGLDLARVNEIFRSIWGVTAVLPLVGVQYERLGEIITRLGEAADNDEVLKAWKEFFDTGLYQFERMVSLFENIAILVGTSILSDLTQTLKIVNWLLVALQGAAQANQALVGIFFRVALSMFAATGIISAMLALRAGLNLVNLSMNQAMAKFMLFPQLARFGIGLSLGNIMTAITLTIASLHALGLAWEKNLLNIPARIQETWGKALLVFDTVKKLLSRQGGFDSWLTGEEWGELGEQGLQGFITILWGFIVRLQAAWRGLKKGFLGFFEAVYEGIASFFGPFEMFTDVFEQVEEFLRNLIKPGRDNINLWARLGHAVGITLGAIVALATVLRTTGFIGKMAIFALNLRPLWIAAGLVAGAFFLIRRALSGNEDKIDNYAESLARFQENAGYGTLGDIFGEERLRAATIALLKFRDAVSVFGATVRDEGWRAAGLSLLEPFGMDGEVFTKALDGIQGFYSTAKESVVSFYDYLKGRGGELWATMSPALTAVRAWFSQFITNPAWAVFWTQFKVMADEIFGAFQDLFGMTMNWIESLAIEDSAGSGLIWFLTDVTDLITSLVRYLRSDAFATMFTTVFGSLLDLAVELWKTFAALFRVIGRFSGGGDGNNIFTNMIGGLATSLQLLLIPIREVLELLAGEQGLGKTLRDTFTGIKDNWFETAGQGIAAYFFTMPLLRMLGSMMGRFFQGNLIGRFLAEGVKNWIGKLIMVGKDAGKELWRALVNGITSSRGLSIVRWISTTLTRAFVKFPVWLLTRFSIGMLKIIPRIAALFSTFLKDLILLPWIADIGILTPLRKAFKWITGLPFRIAAGWKAAGFKSIFGPLVAWGLRAWANIKGIFASRGIATFMRTSFGAAILRILPFLGRIFGMAARFAFGPWGVAIWGLIDLFFILKNNWEWITNWFKGTKFGEWFLDTMADLWDNSWVQTLIDQLKGEINKIALFLRKDAPFPELLAEETTARQVPAGLGVDARGLNQAAAAGVGLLRGAGLRGAADFLESRYYTDAPAPTQDFQSSAPPSEYGPEPEPFYLRTLAGGLGPMLSAVGWGGMSEEERDRLMTALESAADGSTVTSSEMATLRGLISDMTNTDIVIQVDGTNLARVVNAYAERWRQNGRGYRTVQEE